MGDYIRLNSSELQEKINTLLKVWSNFLKSTLSTYKLIKNDVLVNDIENYYVVNLFLIREIFERVHQREDYFERYHKKLKMSNFKEIGLIAYWITKLKPFHLKDIDVDGFLDARINEEFALFFIFFCIKNYIKSSNEHYQIKKITPDLYNEILYTMQYRDMSKEAYGCMVELIYIAMKSSI